MKSLIKNIARSKFGISLRNKLNLKPIHINFDSSITSLSVSDAFPWRTDNSYETMFKFTDILNFFFNINRTNAKIIFYNNLGVKIKSVLLEDLNTSNEIVINKSFLDGLEGHGTFYIFHNAKKNPLINEVISNKCYTGFSYKGNLHSFVHGNTIVRGESFNSPRVSSDFVLTSLFSNNIYKIQSLFENLDRTEFFFSNPTSKTIKFSIDNEYYTLKKNQCKIVENKSKKDITVKSNCYFLRPIIFNYKNDFIDVYHS